MEVKITKKEALKYANILMIAFNENRNVDEKIKAYYDEINPMR